MPEVPIRRQHKKPRPQSSCAICHKRKVKCSKTLPCLQCQKHGCPDQCRFDGLQPSITTASAGGSTAGDSMSPGTGSDGTSNGVKAAASSLTAQSLLEQADAGRKDIETLVKGRLGASRKDSKYATHDWTWSSKSASPRGRTHTTGVLPHFDPLLIYVGKTRLGDHKLEDDDASMKQKRIPASLKDYTVASLYDDIGPLNRSLELILRYFDTWHTVFPLVDRKTFDMKYGDMLVDPKSASVCLVIQTLLMMALANETYSPQEARVSAEKIMRWLEIASDLSASAVASGEVHIDSVRASALLNLAEQVLSIETNTTAGYIRSGTSIRIAMTLSMHRSRPAEGCGSVAPVDEHSLWNTIVELDQHACLGAGMPPSLPDCMELDDPTRTSPATRDGGLLQDLDQANLRGLLIRTLPLRHRILGMLNGDQHLMFEHVVELSTALTKAFDPVSTCQDIPAASKTFQYEYVFFVYRRFMSALHRLFAVMGHEPAFYISRAMAIRLARRHMRDVCAVWGGVRDVSSFSALLAGNGIMFRSEIGHAIMTIAHELYREGDEVQAVILSVENGRPGLFETFKDFFGFLERKVKTKEVPASFFLVPAMVYAHIQVSARYQVGSSDYCRAMVEAGTEAAKWLSTD